MASTFVNDLRLNEMATGDQSGSWGTVTNTNLELIAEAFSFGTESITTNADTHTTTIADGATDPGRSMFLKYTGTLDSACTITLGPNTVSKLWFIENGTSGSQNIIIKQGSGATITIPPGDTKAIYSDGAGSGGKMVDAFASLSVVDLKVQDDLTVTDDMTVGGTLGVTGIATFTDDIIIGDGKTIGSASDVDAITIAANGQVTLTQTLIGTALDISGDIDVDGTTNLDATNIVGAVDVTGTVTADAYALDSLALPSAGTATIFNRNTDSSLYIQTSSGNTVYLLDGSQNTMYGVSPTSHSFAISNVGVNTITATESVFNETSLDRDFRVESDGNTHALFVDAGNNGVGIFNSADTSLANLAVGLTGVAIAGDTDGATIGKGGVVRLVNGNNFGTTNATVMLLSGGSGGSVGQISSGFGFARHSDSTWGTQIKMYVHPNDTADIDELHEAARVGPLEFVINETSNDYDFRVESNGNANMLFVDGGNDAVVIGHNDATNGTFASGQRLQMVGTDFVSSSFGLSRFSADGSGASITLSKSRAAGIGTDTVVQNNDDLGSIIFTGADGTDLSTQGAEIKAEVDGTPGGNDMPTRLTFATTGDGNSSTTERMRINNAGIITFADSHLDAFTDLSSSGNILSMGFGATFGNTAQVLNVGGFTGAYDLIIFRNGNGIVGTIGINGSATSYATSSDYRLKTDVQQMTGASARVQALNPVNFKWIADGTRVDGFLAHEAQAVVPEAVTGTKDAMMDEEYQVSAATGDIYTPATDAYVDEDGNNVDAINEVIHSANAEQPETLADGKQWRETTPKVIGTRSVPDMQGIDQSKMVPLLVAALQEALARITALEKA